MNHIILFLHVTTICVLTLAALRFGKEMMIAWLSLLVVAMNLFLLKQVTLFGLHVTSSDALGVGYLLGLNLIQEFFGKKEALKSVWISLFIACGFLLLSSIHLAYLPNNYDTTHVHFQSLLQPMPRIICASLFSFLVIQFIDLSFFGFLKVHFQGRFLTMRTTIALLLSQTIDTFLFSYLGLYGLVASVPHIICLSLAIKGIVILFSTPFIIFSKKVVDHVKV